jgi:hypothetical protein
MNAADFTFGVEIETTMPSGSVRTGGHGNGIQVPWLPEGWLADNDPSIRPRSGRIGCEFVSPVLKGAEGLRQVVDVVAKIRAAGGTVNDSCGIHVHVGFNKQDTAAVERLLAVVANHEKAIYAVTGTKNRERGVGSRYGTCWCQSIKQFGNARNALSSPRGPASYRYNLVNLTSYNPTVEFRAFSGSLNATKVVGYIRLCVGLTQKAMTAKRSCKFDSCSTRFRGRFSEGRAEVARMFTSLRWFGNSPFGVIEGEGIPSIKATKKIMREMANKYDRQR